MRPEPLATPEGTRALPPVRRERLAEQVYDVLFHRIVTGEMPEGTRLPSEHGLCGSLGVSRPVLRDALEKLRADGLIVSRRGAGSQVARRDQIVGSKAAPVRPLPIEKIDQLLSNLEFRTIVEPEAAALAALRRTDRDLDAIGRSVEIFRQVAIEEGGVGHHLDCAFHVAVAAASANPRLHAAVRSVEYDIDHGVNLARHLSSFDHLERRLSIYDEHRRIFESIRDRDVRGARDVMRGHLEQARMRMMNRRPST